jgi:hypothetical protein
MSDFMSDDVDSTLITSKKSRSDECEAGVFHTTIWERRRKDEQIITAPFIWCQQLFASSNELFGILHKPPLVFLSIPQ